MTDHDETVDEHGRCVLTELLPNECGCRLHATARSASGRGRTGPGSHEWRRDDDMVVAAAYFDYGTNNLPAAAKAQLAELIGCSVASVAYKLGNLHSYVTDRDRSTTAALRCDRWLTSCAALVVATASASPTRRTDASAADHFSHSHHRGGPITP